MDSPFTPSTFLLSPNFNGTDMLDMKGGWTSDDSNGNEGPSAIPDNAMDHTQAAAAAELPGAGKTLSKWKRLEQTSSSEESGSSSSSEDEGPSPTMEAVPVPDEEAGMFSENESEDGNEDAIDARVQKNIKTLKDQSIDIDEDIIVAMQTPRHCPIFMGEAHKAEKMIKKIQNKRNKTQPNKAKTAQLALESSSFDVEERPSKKSKKSVQKEHSEPSAKKPSKLPAPTSQRKTSSSNRRTSDLPQKFQKKLQGLKTKTVLPWHTIGYKLQKGADWLYNRKQVMIKRYTTNKIKLQAKETLKAAIEADIKKLQGKMTTARDLVNRYTEDLKKMHQHMAASKTSKSMDKGATKNKKSRD